MSHTCKRLVKTLLKNEVSQTCTDILVSGSLDVYKDRKKIWEHFEDIFFKIFQNLSPLLRKLARICRNGKEAVPTQTKEQRTNQKEMFP